MWQKLRSDSRPRSVAYWPACLIWVANVWYGSRAAVSANLSHPRKLEKLIPDPMQAPSQVNPCPTPWTIFAAATSSNLAISVPLLKLPGLPRDTDATHCGHGQARQACLCLLDYLLNRLAKALEKLVIALGGAKVVAVDWVEGLLQRFFNPVSYTHLTLPTSDLV